jgi:hypothetical protein
MRTQKKSSVLGKIIIFSLVAVTAVTYIFTKNAEQTEASGLTSAYVYLSRIKTSITSGVTMTFVVKPSANVASGGTLTIRFPDADDNQWCHDSGGSSLANSVDMTGFVDVLESVISLPGTLTASCTTGTGAGSYDTITVSGLTALTAGTAYGVRVSGNAATLGTASSAGDHIVTVNVTQGTNIQSYSYGIDLITDDQVVISATVADAPTVNCTLSTNTLSLGTLFRAGSYAAASHTFTASTSLGANGYYVAAWGTGDGSTNAGLYNVGGPYLISSNFAGNTVNLAAVEGYGLRATDPDAGGSAAVHPDFANATASVFGTIGRTSANAKILFYQTSVETAGDTSTIYHGASAGAGATVGNYTETVTFMCGGYY